MNLKDVYRKLLKREPDTPFQITTPITELSKIPHGENQRGKWIRVGDLVKSYQMTEQDYQRILQEFGIDADDRT